MDFANRYTQTQQAFRIAVQSWLDVHAPRGLNIPDDGRPLDQATQAAVKEFRRKLGAQGWLAPSWPREWGGGALSPAFEVVVREELQHLHLPSLGDNRLWINPMLVWGTPEQQRRYVVPALRGETITWLGFAEPNAGSDLASLETRAVRDGDAYVLNGIKAWVTGRFDPDYLWTLAVTDPSRPQGFNLGMFMVDCHLPGFEIRTRTLLVGSERFVHLNDVRVPADCLIGDPYAGWEVAQSTLEQERGGYPARVARPETIQAVLGDEASELL